MLTPLDLTRRKFIGNACAAVGATGLLSALAQLRVIGAVAGDAAGLQPPSDYKALVCVFLYGGNDSNNVIIPYDTTSYSQLLRPSAPRSPCRRRTCCPITPEDL